MATILKFPNGAEYTAEKCAEPESQEDTAGKCFEELFSLSRQDLLLAYDVPATLPSDFGAPMMPLLHWTFNSS